MKNTLQEIAEKKIKNGIMNYENADVPKDKLTKYMVKLSDTVGLYNRRGESPAQLAYLLEIYLEALKKQINKNI